MVVSPGRGHNVQVKMCRLVAESSLMNLKIGLPSFMSLAARSGKFEWDADSSMVLMTELMVAVVAVVVLVVDVFAGLVGFCFG
jgi:hypothetical protein